MPEVATITKQNVCTCKLVREIAAIAALKEAKTIEALGSSVKKAAKSPFLLA